eukprot:1612965-Rhodomonas_salina.2
MAFSRNQLQAFFQPFKELLEQRFDSRIRLPTSVRQTLPKLKQDHGSKLQPFASRAQHFGDLSQLFAKPAKIQPGTEHVMHKVVPGRRLRTSKTTRIKHL